MKVQEKFGPDGQVAIVTGGGAGIGRGIAELFAGAGPRRQELGGHDPAGPRRALPAVRRGMTAPSSSTRRGRQKRISLRSGRDRESPAPPDGFAEALLAARGDRSEISCAKLWHEAERFSATRIQAGRLPGRLGIKVRDCHLGTF